MQSTVFIHKETGRPETQINLFELSNYRKATDQEQANYYKAIDGLSKEQIKISLDQHYKLI